MPDRPGSSAHARPFSRIKKSGLLSLAQRPESSGFFYFFSGPQPKRTSYPAYAHKRCEMHTPCFPARFAGYAELRTPPVPWLGWLSLLALHLSRIPAEHPPYLHTLRTAPGTLLLLLPSCKRSGKACVSRAWFDEC